MECFCDSLWIKDSFLELLGAVDLISDILVARSVFWAHQGFRDEDGRLYMLSPPKIVNAVAIPIWFKIGLIFLGFSVMVTFTRNGIDRDKIHMTYYEGGHMMYTNLPSLEKLSRDLRVFIRKSAQRKRGPALIPTGL